MVARTEALAAERGAALQTAIRTWAELGGERFDAVPCVGNSLTHASGRAGRRTALDGMRRVARDGAPLVITSRNWERPRASGDETVERGGRPAAGGRGSAPGAPPPPPRKGGAPGGPGLRGRPPHLAAPPRRAGRGPP